MWGCGLWSQCNFTFSLKSLMSVWISKWGLCFVSSIKLDLCQWSQQRPGCGISGPSFRTPYYGDRILHRDVIPNCRVCRRGLLTVTHIMSGCVTLAMTNYTDQHNQITFHHPLGHVQCNHCATSFRRLERFGANGECCNNRKCTSLFSPPVVQWLWWIVVFFSDNLSLLLICTCVQRNVVIGNFVATMKGATILIASKWEAQLNWNWCSRRPCALFCW